MRDFPLLDLADLYRDAHAQLCALETLAAELYFESDDTWADMALLLGQAQVSLTALGTLPPGLVEGIATDAADLREMEDHAS
jgi:hypothetical protein